MARAESRLWDIYGTYDNLDKGTLPLKAIQALMTEQKYTQEQLGGIIGKAQNTLGNRGT